MKTTPANIRILNIRGQKVVLDSDLAAVYGVTTKRLNEQLRRNRKRFPVDFAFQLTADEFESLRPPVATTKEGSLEDVDKIRSPTATTSKRRTTMWSQIATTSGTRRRKTHKPWVFTEHGALQAANILQSDRAIAMSVYVIRAFVEQRENLAANAVILRRLAEIDRALLAHDGALREIYQQLLPLLKPPPEPPRRPIGFSAGA